MLQQAFGLARLFRWLNTIPAAGFFLLVDGVADDCIAPVILSFHLLPAHQRWWRRSYGREAAASTPNFCDQRIGVVNGHPVGKQLFRPDGLTICGTDVKSGFGNSLRFGCNHQALEPGGRTVVARNPYASRLDETFWLEPSSIHGVCGQVADSKIAA
jgi:hypothetical protein